MLDSQTKKRIDDCRDILVGKITDPKSQVEQITIAMIYKFMDDMDIESEEYGGERQFFVGDYHKYSWSKIFSPRVDAYEMLNLYGEGIEKMSENPNLNPLFRSIFKDAYLPYRDPETLKLFLKTIDGFSYEHSEKLGDAYEYLLSVLGSQGGAGQFRTPRHIIDFIVDLVEPKKGDRILDPACGTSGFLISSYKRILERNTDKRLGDKLSSMEKKQLLNSIYGYDLDPNMVRLSLVNLFLHGFTEDELNVIEYDSLTSEDRWNEYFDVILANPPFMTPKGGIRPHNRFSIKSNRAEVLFVNYIMEHLTPKGRAGIVVPEGIMFQSGTAYKQLRKSLVEKYLLGVVSLPSGVFNPYSGVKTSILILDRELSQKTDKIFFGKVENDGYDLGAQRRQIDKNDLPKIKDGVLEYIQNLTDGIDEEHQHISYLSKEEILNSSDVGLTYERYNVIEIHSSFETHELKKLVEFKRGTSITKKNVIDGEYPVIAGGQKPAYYHNEYNRSGETITISSSGAYSGFVNFFEKPIFMSDSFSIKSIDNKILSNKFLYHVLKSKQDYIYTLQTGGGQPHVYPKSFDGFQIPLPPLEIQKEIVDELEQYQKVIDGAKQVVDNYKPHIDIDESWEKEEIGKVCEINPKKSEVKHLIDELNVSFIPMADLNENSVDFIPKESRDLSEVYKGYTYFKDNDVLVAKVTPCFENGKAGICKNLVNGIGFGSSEYYVLRCNEKVLPLWIYLNITDPFFKKNAIDRMTGTGGLKRVPKDFVKNYKISIPPLKIQKELVEKVEKEFEIIQGNKKLIESYTQKIEDRINKIWEE